MSEFVYEDCTDIFIYLSLFWNLQIVRCAHCEWTPCKFHMPAEVLHIGITAQYRIFTIIQFNKEYK